MSMHGGEWLAERGQESKGGGERGTEEIEGR